MKMIIPTVTAEAYEKGAFELTFVPYARYAKRNGVSTMIEVAPTPTGGLFRFSTFVDVDDEASELANVSYQLVPSVFPCKCPIDEARNFLYAGDIDGLVQTGEAEYMEELHTPELSPEEQEEKTIADMESVNKEIEAKLEDLAVEDDEEEATDEIADEDDSDDNDTAENLFDNADDEDETSEEAAGSDKEIEDFDDWNPSNKKDEVALAKEDEVETLEGWDNTPEDDESEDDEPVDVSNLSPEEIRDMLNNRLNPEAAKKVREKEEKKEAKSEPALKGGSYIGAPAPENVTSHKEPYRDNKQPQHPKHEKQDKKRKEREKERDFAERREKKHDKKMDKRARKDAQKAAKRRDIEKASDIDFSAIVSNAFK